MKKKLIAVLCAMTLMLGMTVNAMAEVSPTGKKDTTASTDKTDKAPKTGEGDLLIYGIAAAAAFLSGTAVISRKKLETLK